MAQQLSQGNYNTAPAKSSLREELDLTPEQREIAKKLRHESQKKIEPYRAELDTLRRAQMELGRDSVKGKRLIANMEVVQQKIEAIQIEHERKFLQILTPVQKAKYNKLKVERKKRMEAYKAYSHSR